MAWSEPPAQALRAQSTPRLSDVDARSTPGWEHGKAAGREFMAERGELLSELQERLYAHGRAGGDRSVLLIIQGLDTSGKGGIVRHVIGMTDPQGVELRAFGPPTAEEREHHYLWRVRNALPAPGRIGVFDRSHYEDVLIVRVEDLAPGADWQERYAEINDFEAEIAASGTTIIKVVLAISYEGQGLRLMRRLDRPDRHWKYDPSDVDARSRWPEYLEAYEDAIAATDTDRAPWYVVPADRRWYARLAVTELLTQALLDLDLDWPEVSFDIEEERARLKATMTPELIEAAGQRRPDHRKKAAKEEKSFADAAERARSDT